MAEHSFHTREVAGSIPAQSKASLKIYFKACPFILKIFLTFRFLYFFQGKRFLRFFIKKNFIC